MELKDVVAASCDNRKIVGMWLGRTFVWPDPWVDHWIDYSTEEVVTSGNQ